MPFPTIQITSGKRQKFIVVSAMTDDGQVDALWGDPNVEWHKDIFDKMAATGHEITEVYGGGRIFVDTDAREVYVWGTSDRYGLAPRYLVESMLEDEFSDYALKFNQEPPQA